MKILYLCPDLGIPILGKKGASVHVRELVSAFRRAGHSVIVAAPLLNKSPWERPADLDATLLHIPPNQMEMPHLILKEFNEMLRVTNSLPGELRRILYNQELRTYLKRRFENDPPDFIYERASLYAIAGVGLARDLNRPLLIELNAPIAMEQATYRATSLGDLAAQAERWALSRADIVLPVSNALCEYVVSMGVNPNRIQVIPNGVNPSIFYPAPPKRGLRTRWGLGDGLVLGFVGGLRPWHDVGTLPVLIGRLIRRYPELRLVIIGEGPLRAELEKEVAEQGLSNHVFLTGAVPHEEIGDLIRIFDVALAPYAKLDHPFYFSPLKLFEYMACGIPVVAARVGQISEVVQDGVTGLLYPPGNLDKLTEACERILADLESRKKMGEAAAKEVERCYTWDHNARRVVEMAQSLIRTQRENNPWKIGA